MDRAALVNALEKHGHDAVSFQALEPGLQTWEADGGVVAYAGTAGGWVAVGGPIASRENRAEVAERFVRAAAARGRRASFFGCDDVDGFGERFARVALGEQPIFRPAEWGATLSTHRRLREQLRRARKKGVVVRHVRPEELAEGSAIRTAVDDLAREWLRSRPMEPMGFLVTLSLYEEPSMHRYYIAERGGVMLAFMSLVPIGAEKGWLVEDVVRGRHAPNGTTELLFDQAMRDAAEDGSPIVTWGLAPLAGAVPWPMRVIGTLGRGLYDFRGLQAFKARLHPQAWQAVYVVYLRGETALPHLIDALRAFAGGSLLRFGLRTVARRPLVLAWLLTLALIPWTALLFVLLAFRVASPLFGFPRSELFLWALFDAGFATVLVRAF
jgi:phosphatidylglycerol lysyltransferase